MRQGTTVLKKILVVDDESLIRYSLAMMLQNDDVEVRSVSTGTDALTELHCHYYDLCFLDIHLPDISGLEILKEIREISPDTIVIIISADEPEEGSMAERKDREYYVPKPFDLFQVKAFVDKVLREGTTPHREKTRAAGNTGELAGWTPGDQRAYERRPIEKRITCLGTAPRPHAEDEALVFDADVLDIGDGGVGIAVEFELRPGQTLRFFDRTVACLGIVRWIRRVGETPWYRSGIQFTEPQRMPPEGAPEARC